ncbi:MAG: hypothetical protein LIO91_12120, partial [Bacteroidales bacterium]|nr:hypothetical protein [Bacteroidales bacterium]
APSQPGRVPCGSPQGSPSQPPCPAVCRGGLPLDLVAQDLREAIHHISSITTPITTPDLLATIFTRFCIGK